MDDGKLSVPCSVDALRALPSAKSWCRTPWSFTRPVMSDVAILTQLARQSAASERASIRPSMAIRHFARQAHLPKSR